MLAQGRVRHVGDPVALVVAETLEQAKELVPDGFTKSGLMVGLGESREEIMQVMDDLRAARVDFLTIGQYLQPTKKHAALARFWTPDEFKGLEAVARANDGRVTPGTGWVDLFIYPGFDFRIVSGLLTNFHLPRSTLLERHQPVMPSCELRPSSSARISLV
jgi:hypothetical protein